MTVAALNRLCRKYHIFDTQAAQDPGCYSDVHFETRLDSAATQANKNGELLSVAVIKVDNFADINARYSSATAQRVISEMGCLFKSTLCTNDLIGRYADDKIGVVLIDAEPSMFTTLCARLIDKVQSHDWETLVSGLSVNVSLGLSEANADKLGLLGGAEKNLSRQYAATPTALGA